MIAQALKDIILGIKVSAALSSDPRIDSFGLTATVHEGRVVLEGMVDTEQQRAAAEEAVLAVPGVTDVENRVSVGKSSSGSRFDLG